MIGGLDRKQSTKMLRALIRDTKRDRYNWSVSRGDTRPGTGSDTRRNRYRPDRYVGVRGSGHRQITVKFLRYVRVDHKGNPICSEGFSIVEIAAGDDSVVLPETGNAPCFMWAVNAITADRFPDLWPLYVELAGEIPLSCERVRAAEQQKSKEESNRKFRAWRDRVAATKERVIALVTER